MREKNVRFGTRSEVERSARKKNDAGHTYRTHKKRREKNSWRRYKRAPRKMQSFASYRAELGCAGNAAGLLVSESEIEDEMDRIQCVNCTTFRQRWICLVFVRLFSLSPAFASRPPLCFLLFCLFKWHKPKQHQNKMLSRWGREISIYSL